MQELSEKDFDTSIGTGLTLVDFGAAVGAMGVGSRSQKGVDTRVGSV